MTRGTVVALVPIRSLRDSKTRLAEHLTVEARAALTERMLRGVVRAALGSGTVGAVVVVSPDPAVAAIARSLGRAVIPLAQSPDSPGLNPAVTLGRDWAMEQEASALVVLFGDLPLLTGGDVQNLVRRDSPVVIAPDRHGTGTNALLLRLGGQSEGSGGGFRFQFGVGSYARHVDEAHRLGLEVATSLAVGTAFDLDTPEDWQALADRLAHDEVGAIRGEVDER